MPIAVSSGSLKLDPLSTARMLLEQRHTQAAIAAFDRAEKRSAERSECCAGRWQAHMLLGNFEAAWRESDTIRLLDVHDPYRVWNGESLAGKRVILRCLHGFGDAVQHFRYLRLLRQTVSQLTLEVPPRLEELAHCVDGADQVISWGQDRDGWEMEIEITELPYIFRTVASDLPLSTRYIRLPNRLHTEKEVTAPAAKRLRVGIVWAAGEWNPTRSIPLSLWRGVLAIPDAEFWNLQGGVARREWGSVPGDSLIPADECDRGILPLATTIASLDLVITVDSLAAHLAGALGKDAWVLLQHAADWRWMMERTDSPWYPSLRLFRQPQPGDWKCVMEAVGGELELRAQQRGAATG